MRVLHVIDSLSGSGGAEQGLVREIILFSDEVDQRLCRLFANDELQGKLAEAGIMVSPLGLSSAAAGRNWPLAVWRLVGLIRSYRPDVLHSSLFIGNLVTQIAGALTRTPVLSTFTSSGDRALIRAYQPGAGTWKASILRWLAARAARSNKVWFRSVGQDALETNVRLLGLKPDRIMVIPRGVAPLILPDPPQSRNNLELPDSGPILLNIGRQTALKSHVFLLDALAEVRQHVDAHLVICGREGDATTATQARIDELNIGDHVTLTGYTPLVHHYLAQASVFVFPSVMEGLPTAMLEAMAARTPIVAFDIPPVREATRDGRAAWLVPVGDQASFVTAILQMLDPSVAQPYLEAGTGILEARGSPADVSSRLEQRLREVSTS